MPAAPEDIVKRLHACERVALLSDRIIQVGPFNLGIDAALALLPIGGGAYTIGLGAWLLYQGWRTQASSATLMQMAVYVGVDAITAEVPILGSVVDSLFPGHILAVRALRADIEKRFGPVPELTPKSDAWSRFTDRFRKPFAAGAS